jgi:hypothetical protein
MNEKSYRHGFVAGMAASVLVAGVVTFLTSSSPAGAASHSGALQVKGPGSTYAPMGSSVTLAAAAGTAVTFGLKVVNTGPGTAQFRVEVHQSVLATATVVVTAGSLNVTPLASSDGYYTNPIAAGGNQLLTVKVTRPAGSPQSAYNTFAYLYATDGTYLGIDYLTTNVQAPAKGTTALDLFARNGSQPFIGGSYSGQTATSPAIATGASTQFTVKLQNDGTVAGKIGLLMGYSDPESCGHASFPFTVKDGFTDVTAAAKGSYLTPTLAVGASRTLTVTVKNNGGCNSAQMFAQAKSVIGLYGPYSYLLVNRTA